MTRRELCILFSVFTFLLMSCSSKQGIRVDSVRGIQKQIENGVKVIDLIPGKEYSLSNEILIHKVNGLTINGNGAKFIMDSSVPNDNRGLFKVLNSRNIKINNLTLDGSRSTRRKGKYIPHNLKIYASSNVVLESISSINSLGDGIIVAASPATSFKTFCKDIKIYDCHVDNATRNGLSLVGTHDVEVIGGSYNNSNGADPQTGIDIEPDVGSVRPGAKNILVKGVQFKENVVAGLSVLNGATMPEGITIDSCFFYQSDFGIKNTGYDNKIVRNTIEDCGTAIISVRHDAVSDRHDNTRISKNTISHVHTGIDYRGYGGKISENTIVNSSEHGIILFGNVTTQHAATVVDNVIRNGGNHSGIGMRHFYNTEICKNKIHNIKNHGIVVAEGDYTVKGNMLNDIGNIGIELTGSNAELIENSIDNATYAAIRFGKGGSKPSGGSVISNKIGKVKKPGPGLILDENGLIKELSENTFDSDTKTTKIKVKKMPVKMKQKRADIKIQR